MVCVREIKIPRYTYHSYFLRHLLNIPKKVNFQPFVVHSERNEE